MDLEFSETKELGRVNRVATLIMVILMNYGYINQNQTKKE